MGFRKSFIYLSLLLVVALAFRIDVSYSWSIPYYRFPTFSVPIKSGLEIIRPAVGVPSSVFSFMRHRFFFKRVLSTFESVAFFSRGFLARKLAASIIHRILVVTSKSASGLTVQVSNSTTLDVIRGNLKHIEIKFDKVYYDLIQITGGGTLLADGIDMKMRRLLFIERAFLRRSYNLSAEFSLTPSDVINSKLFRDWMQLLVDSVVAANFGNQGKSRILKVTISARRIHIHGDLITSIPLTPSIPWQFSTAVGVRPNKQVVFLCNMSLVFNNQNNGLRFQTPLILSELFDVDLGENFFVDDLVISNQSIYIRANCKIWNCERFAVAPVIKRGLYRYDLSDLLSKLMSFKGGFVTKFLFGRLLNPPTT